MPVEPVPLSTLAAIADGEIFGAGDPLIADVHHDSRLVQAGSLFVAVRGSTSDGHEYVESVSGTAAAVCVEERAEVTTPQLVVANTRQALGQLANEVNGRPSEQIAVAGITGTNGKTTVTYLLESIVTSAGQSAGLIGTIGARIAGAPVPTTRTTPEATELHRLLASMVESGVSVAAIEVSSHALELFRVEGVAFAIVAFTNLSQDHLDFHGDMERYYLAKAQLFDHSRARHAVINTADEWGKRLYNEVDDTTLPVTTVLGDNAAFGVADVTHTIGSSTFTLDTPIGSTAIRLPLSGRFNVDNAVVAAACAVGLGFTLAEVQAGLESVPPIPGRVEPVDVGQGFAVLVDYAHTPEAVAAVVEETALLADGRVIVVVGAGGDRDRDKRPLMGAAAAASSAVVIVTADNPRSEDPLVIATAVARGARAVNAAEVVEVPDRSEAIRRAIQMARPGDAVLILGKGHELGQEAGGETVPFDDRAVARLHLESR